MSSANAGGSSIGRKSPWNIWHWRPVGPLCRSPQDWWKQRPPFLKGAHRLSHALGLRAKWRLHRNLGQTWLHFLKDLLEKQGVTVACCGRRTLEGEVSGILSSMYSSTGGHFRKILPHPSVPRSPGPNNNPGGISAPPISKRLPKDLPRHTATSNLTQRQIPTHQWAGTSPSHQEVYSKPPYQLQPQGGQTPEGTEATTLLPVERSPHQKPVKMKTQRTITQMREKEKSPENQLSEQEILSLQEKDFRLLMLKRMQDIGNKREANMDNVQETLSKEI